MIGGTASRVRPPRRPAPPNGHHGPGAVGPGGSLAIAEYRFSHKDGPWHIIESVGETCYMTPPWKAW